MFPTIQIRLLRELCRDRPRGGIGLSCVVIGRAQIRLLRELVGVGYAGGEVGRQEDRERYARREKAGRYAGGVLGAWDRDYQASVGGRGRIVGD